MHQDPKRIRKHRATMNFDDYEEALIRALENYTGLSRATLLRKMLMAQLESVLLPTPDSMPPAARRSEYQISNF